MMFLCTVCRLLDIPFDLTLNITLQKYIYSSTIFDMPSMLKCSVVS